MIQSIAVFCGSNEGKNPLYKQEATETGKKIALKKIKLVYGGGRKGLMGAVADAALENGGHVTGVITEQLKDLEHMHQNLTEIFVVADMHTRKKMMYELCDMAIILPGGYGTLDELFEMITWNQLSIHNKKIVLLNTAGYYNALIAHLEKMYIDGFLYSDWKTNIAIKENAEDMMKLVEKDGNEMK